MMIEEVNLGAGGADRGVQPQELQKGSRPAFLHADYQGGW